MTNNKMMYSSTAIAIRNKNKNFPLLFIIILMVILITLTKSSLSIALVEDQIESSLVGLIEEPFPVAFARRATKATKPKKKKKKKQKKRKKIGGTFFPTRARTTGPPLGNPVKETFEPTSSPSRSPSKIPTVSYPSFAPITSPSETPSKAPSRSPTVVPSKSPTIQTALPTLAPSSSPSQAPSSSPVLQPSVAPTEPTSSPTTKQPSASPTKRATSSPTVKTPSPTAKTSSPTPTSSPTIPPLFTIRLLFGTPVTDAQRAAFDRAVEKWQSIITADFATDLVIPAGSHHCGHTFLERTVIDDLAVAVRVIDIDGAGSTLARAGICVISGSGKAAKPRFGVIEFDIADVERMMFTGNFEGVVVHEIGHVLGLGTLWESDHYNLIKGNDSPLVYTGVEGGLGHVEIGGTGTQAIIEDTGGVGTARGHFKESVYGSEVMTGWASTKMPISRLTIRALRDLGYTTDITKADPFVITQPTSRPTSFIGRRRRLRQEEVIMKDDKEMTKKEPLVSDMLNFAKVQLKGRLKPGRSKPEAEM